MEEKMKRKLMLWGMLLIFGIFIGCSNNSDSNEITTNPEISFNGSIRYVEIEGGFYVIDDESGEVYDPINLSEELQDDGIQVYGSALIRNDVASSHMYGQIVEILEINQSTEEP
jgi:hypothetical protein